MICRALNSNSCWALFLNANVFEFSDISEDIYVQKSKLRVVVDFMIRSMCK